jgi:hypothetical protein
MKLQLKKGALELYEIGSQFSLYMSGMIQRGNGTAVMRMN